MNTILRILVSAAALLTGLSACAISADDIPSDNTSTAEAALIVPVISQLTAYRHTIVHSTSADTVTSADTDVGDTSNRIVFTFNTTGAYAGAPADGSMNGYLAVFDSAHQLLWSRQLGTLAEDYVMAAKAKGAYVWAAGYSKGNLDGMPNTGGEDYFLTKDTIGGTKVWTVQDSLSDVPGYSTNDRAYALAADGAGNVYVSGATQGGASWSYTLFVAKYEPDGHRVWARQSGEWQKDTPMGLTADDGGNVIATGSVDEHLGGIRTRKLDADGNQVWSAFTSTGYGMEKAAAVTTDAAGDVYVLGKSRASSLSSSGMTTSYWRPILVKLDGETGTMVWYRMLVLSTTGTGTTPGGMARRPNGNLVFNGSYETATTTKEFVAEYSPSGQLVLSTAYEYSGVHAPVAMLVNSANRLTAAGSLTEYGLAGIPWFEGYVWQH